MASRSGRWFGGTARLFAAIAVLALLVAGALAVQAHSQDDIDADDGSSNEASVTIGTSTTEYSTFKEAVAAAQSEAANNDAKVTLLKDIDVTEQVVFSKPGAYTLDFNSFTVNFNPTNVKHYFIIAGDENGTLPSDVDDMSEAVKLSIIGSGHIEAKIGTVIRSVGTIVYGENGTAPSVTYHSNEEDHSIFKVEETCRLTIDSGDFVHTTGADNKPHKIILTFGQTTVNGGTFNSKIYQCTYLNYESTVTINGGNVPEVEVWKSAH